MNFFKFALKNLIGRPIRTVLTIGGVALAVAVAVSLGGFNQGYKKAIEGSIEQLGFQVMVMAKGCPYEAATLMLKGGTGLLYLPDNAYTQIKEDPDVQAITPIFIGLAEKQNVGIMGDEDEGDGSNAFTIMSGIDLKSFKEMKPWFTFKTGEGYDGGRWFDENATDEIVMGYEVAEYENRKVGDTFYASVTPNGAVEPVMHEFKVVGVLERTGSQDDGSVYIPLKAAQTIFNRPNELTIVGIKLKEFNGIRMREFEGRWLRIPEVQVVSLQQVKGALISLIGTAQIMIAAVAIIAVIVAIIGVINAIMMSVFERMGEIGIMKAVGASRKQVFILIWIETLFLTLIGAIVGCLLAIVGSGAVDTALRYLLNMGVTTDMVDITLPLLVLAVVSAVILGLLAGIWPSLRAANLRPVQAIRSSE